MSQQVLDDIPLPDRSQRWVVVFVLASLALHGVGLLALSWMKDRPALTAQGRRPARCARSGFRAARTAGRG